VCVRANNGDGSRNEKDEERPDDVKTGIRLCAGLTRLFSTLPMTIKNTPDTFTFMCVVIREQLNRIESELESEQVTR
jgi:hypothetical protein